jgi:alpha-beta hydrolase superfamily lysophospholipase
VLVAALVLVAGCAHGDNGEARGLTAPGSSGTSVGSASPEAEATNALDGCVRKNDGRTISIRVAGDRLDGVVLGHGPIGVVLAHERGRNLCDWLPYARHLARMGYRALAFDFKTYAAGLVESVQARDLEKREARRTMLVGASMGGTAVLDAARDVSGLVGVVSVSGPASYGDANAARAVPTLQAAVLFIVARDDSEFVGDVRSLYKRAGSADKTLVILPGFAHGTGFFAPPLGGRAVRLTDRFVADHVGQ